MGEDLYIGFYGATHLHVWVFIENRLFAADAAEKDHFDNCLGKIIFKGL